MKKFDIDLEKIVEILDKTVKNIPKGKILRTLIYIGKSARGAYPEYYVIFISGIESFKIYKESTLNLLNHSKDYIYNLYKFLFR